MNRRGFLKLLGLAPAAPLIPTEKPLRQFQINMEIRAIDADGKLMTFAKDKDGHWRPKCEIEDERPNFRDEK